MQKLWPHNDRKIEKEIVHLLKIIDTIIIIYIILIPIKNTALII